MPMFPSLLSRPIVYDFDVQGLENKRLGREHPVFKSGGAQLSEDPDKDRNAEQEESTRASEPRQEGGD